MQPDQRMRLLPMAILLLLATACQNAVLPARYDKEYSGDCYNMPEMPDIESLASLETLPDPFTFCDGSRLKSFKQWEKRRFEIMSQIQHYEIGFRPETPLDCISVEMRHGNPVKPETDSPFPMPDIPLAKDTISVSIKVGNEILNINCPVIYPEGDGPFPAIIGIGFWAGAGSLPVSIFSERNIAMIGFPFMEVMAHHQERGKEPINRLYPELSDMGAYAAWSWGISRVIDAIGLLGAKSRIDLEHIAVSGCSFAGKMALFAGAFDERIALTIAQEPGGGGAASWRVSETLGEVETVGRTDYTWFKESMRRFSDENVAKMPVDHHELCALVAPRALLVLGNPDYPWLADESAYVSCHAARKVWERFGVQDRMGWSFIAGHGHCQLPENQYPEVEAFVDRFLLEKKADTNVRIAPMFENTKPELWINW